MSDEIAELKAAQDHDRSGKADQDKARSVDRAAWLLEYGRSIDYGDRPGVKRQQSQAEQSVVGAITVDGAAMQVDKPRDLVPRRCSECGANVPGSEKYLPCEYPLEQPESWHPPREGESRKRAWCGCEACRTNRHIYYGLVKGRGQPSKTCSKEHARLRRNRLVRKNRGSKNV